MEIHVRVVHVTSPPYLIVVTRMFYFVHSCSVKAIEAAIQARQWNKAVQIVELQDDSVAQK